MMPATAAAGCKANVGLDFSLLEACDAEYINADVVEDLTLMTVSEW